AIQGDRLGERDTLPEQLVADIGADDGDPRRLLFVWPTKIAAVFELDRANVLILRLDAGHPRRRRVEGAFRCHSAALQLGAHDRHHRRFGRDGPGVVQGQMDDATGALTAGLPARASAPDDADVLPELAQYLVVALTESFAGGRQDDNRNHSPQDA